MHRAPRPEPAASVAQPQGLRHGISLTTQSCIYGVVHTSLASITSCGHPLQCPSPRLCLPHRIAARQDGVPRANNAPHPSIPLLQLWALPLNIPRAISTVINASLHRPTAEIPTGSNIAVGVLAPSPQTATRRRQGVWCPAVSDSLVRRLAQECCCTDRTDVIAKFEASGVYPAGKWDIYTFNYIRVVLELGMLSVKYIHRKNMSGA